MKENMRHKLYLSTNRIEKLKIEIFFYNRYIIGAFILAKKHFQKKKKHHCKINTFLAAFLRFSSTTN